MRHDDLVYVGHMLDMARQAVDLVRDSARVDFDRSIPLRLPVRYLIQSIGAAARMISTNLKDLHPEIPWHDIVGMRHRVVHDYPDIDEEIVWEVATRDLEVLIATLTPLLPPHLREPHGE